MSNLYLIGMMGCGKSTLAKALEQTSGKSRKDLDAEIEKEEGCSIPDIFRQKGEEYFRTAEMEVLKNLAEESDLIVACGGGIVLNPQNIKIMNESGTIIYLQRDAEKILRDIDASKRPLLNNGAQNLNTIYEKRKPLYESAAHYIIDNNDSIEESVKEIKKCCSGFFTEE